MRGVSLQAKTNMQRVALCLLALLMCSVECGRPAVLPSTIPDPLAYYALDDGSGFELRDTVSGADSGRVLYDANHQSTTYTEPNWTDDERFNKTIQCGAKNGAGEQKDTLQLADVDYGHSLTRGRSASGSGTIRRILMARSASSSSVTATRARPMATRTISTCRWRTPSRSAPGVMENSSTRARSSRRTTRTGTSTPSRCVLAAGQDSTCTLTAYSRRRATRCTSHRRSTRSAPSACAAAKRPTGGTERYFLGKVAHFAIWDSALTSEQVQALNAAYDQAYPPITVNFTAVYVAPVDARHLRQAIGFPIVVIVGLLPGLISCLCARLRATKSGDWKERVRARGRRAMLGAGWLLLVLSLAPTVAYVIGQNMVFDASVLLYCALMLPVGIVCFMLNAIPADLSGGMVLAFFIAVYALIILVTAGLAVLLSGAMQIVFFVQAALSVVGAVATSTVCCIPKGPKQSEKKLLRLWLTSRIFSILLGISFFFLLVDTTWHNSALISWNIATIVVGLEFVVLGAVTTPRCRSALTIMIATVGLGGNEEAAGAAHLCRREISPAASDDHGHGVAGRVQALRPVTRGREVFAINC